MLVSPVTERAATVRTILIMRARANVAIAHLSLDDLTGELRPDQRLRYEHDRDTLIRAADQLATHLHDTGEDDAAPPGGSA